MKKLALVLITLVTIGVSAQDRKEKIKNATPEERVEMRTAKLSEKLDLNENQKKQVKEILTAQQNENKATKKERKEDLKVQHEKLKAKLKPILTEEQFKKMETLQTEKINNIKEKRKQKKE